MVFVLQVKISGGSFRLIYNGTVCGRIQGARSSLMASQLSHVLIVGASARAAAFSALRAGFQPICADLFADFDLQAVAPAARLSMEKAYPRGFVRWLAETPPSPWIYTGTLENWPTIVRDLSQLRPLWGNPAVVLRQVRSPWKVEACLRSAGLPCPRVSRDPPAGPGRWLVKPLAGTVAKALPFGPPTDRRNRAKVSFGSIEGSPCSAVYVGDGEQARLLGVTNQLVGQSWLNAAPFQYCGSVGPHPDDATNRAFGTTGAVLAQSFGLRGLFGVDCVLQGSVPWPVEVNPRYTASVEVLELASGLATLAKHRRIFDPAAGHADERTTPAAKFVGKAVLYASKNVAIPNTVPLPVPGGLGPWDSHNFADIPHTGGICTGHPIVTVFARANSEAECLCDLQQRVRLLDLWLLSR